MGRVSSLSSRVNLSLLQLCLLLLLLLELFHYHLCILEGFDWHGLYFF
jgi:hypothetical protein